MNEIVRSKGVAIGICGSILVICYQATPTLEAIRAVERASDEIVFPTTQVGVAVVIDGAVRPPEAGVRLALLSSIRRFESRTSAVAHVVRQGGFLGAAIRAGLSSMFLISRPKHPTKVFGDIRSAVAWLSQRGQLGGGFTLSDIEQIEQFCISSFPVPPRAQSSAHDRPAT